MQFANFQTLQVFFTLMPNQHFMILKLSKVLHFSIALSYMLELVSQFFALVLR